VVASVKSRYQSVDQDMLGRLRAELDRFSAVDKDSISRTLAISAAQQISSQVTKSFVLTVDAASDVVVDQLLDKLEDIYCAVSGVPREAGDTEDKPEEPITSGPPRKQPPVPPSKTKKPPPSVPPKGSKPPPLGGSGRGPPPSPKENIPKVPSGLTHMAKDRPLGPQRRRPQRKLQRRPMMEGNE